MNYVQIERNKGKKRFRNQHLSSLFHPAINAQD